MIHKVSIIMATYNRAHFILETLESIQKQTHTNWECLIIDDGGTDNTKEVIKPILDNDNRFQYLQRSNAYKKGLPGSRNYGLDLAKGDYIIFFDDDDIVHPQNLELCVNELKNNRYQFCRYLRDVFFDKFDIDFNLSKVYTSYIIGINDIEKVLKNELTFNSCAIMWRKEVFLKDRFQEHLMYAEEWELYSRLLSNNIKGITIEKCLFYGRKHANSNTGEYFSGNLTRITSKKEAIKLVTQNLQAKNLLNKNILNYLAGFAITFRDTQLLKDILDISKIPFINSVFLTFKFYRYPIWLHYKKIEKRLKK
ncbi:glycosyltransferase family 2 protein [Lutibacter sp. HS1-25]|uniref:glycosyltransferase family 2 protein n=1 Tax=Lutibacter sp. HS1-25 TaxID=2485000 RepID=UPI001010365E|nr:glycosyltransferase family 2 protein [Lutibacter sp. HS1-25]RXP52572.1 glycosyltransferase family 2 protein [Lutibacter sp. HS1-25]